MNTLTFNNNTLTTINQDNQVWLTSSDLAAALGYKTADSVTRIFNRNKDEFSSRMTQVIETVKLTASSKTKGYSGNNSEVIESVTSSKTKGLKVKTRIFSLRGCHLLAMFARTDIAKAFRVWVLDILDRETKTTPRQRTPLRQACDRLAVGNMLISDAYKIVTSHYNVEHIDQIPESKLPEAVAFVYDVILARQASNTDNSKYIDDMAYKTNSYALSVHMKYCKAWFDSVRGPLEALNPEITKRISGHFQEGMIAAKQLNRSIGHTIA